MKPAEKLEKLIKEKRYKAGAETYDKALGSFLQAVDEHIKQKSAQTRPKIWRKIVNSRITKLAAAAVIVVVAYVVIHQSGGSIDVATVSFAQITENMKQMPWMHVVTEGTDIVDVEGWVCFERRKLVKKWADGWIRFHDDLKQVFQVYDPDSNTVTISRGKADAFSLVGSSALGFPRLVMEQFEQAGRSVVREPGKYKGKDVTIFKIGGFVGEMGMDMKFEMAVEAERNVVLFLNHKRYDKAGKLVLEGNVYFDYPEKGPESIYDVGVPRSAKTVRGEKEEEKTAYDKAFKEAVSVVDTRENWPEAHDLAIAYWQARNAKNYDEMAIYWPGSATWNRKALKKEEPVEYVFGEVQPGEIEGCLIVPYASKNYFGKHGKYSLEMRLSNEKSSKGRYYIVSGN
ncbi:MAG TPA: hypothetical protein DIU00_10600 [Phycisphaerales bacterium]|nr:hypothetical protein [Phycisphaerales bacterium]